MAAASPSPPDASTGKPVWRCNRAASSIDELAPVNTTMACADLPCGAEKGCADRSSSAANNKLPDLLMKNMAQTISPNASNQQIFTSPLPVMRSLVNFIQLTFDKTFILHLCCRRWHLSLTNPGRTSTRHSLWNAGFFLCRADTLLNHRVCPAVAGLYCNNLICATINTEKMRPLLPSGCMQLKKRITISSFTCRAVVHRSG